MSIFVLLSAGLGFCAFMAVVDPLISGGNYSFYDGEGESAVAERKNLLNQIRDLDLEFSAGKIAEEDYQRLRAELASDVAPLLEKRKNRSGENE